MSLEELGIRDMNLTEQVEEALDEEKTTPTEAPKTWNTAATEVSAVKIFYWERIEVGGIMLPAFRFPKR